MRQAGLVIESFERCYQAVKSKDPRFDGWFFTAVRTTGIYCRPSCPAITPKPTTVTFYPTAAACQRAGYRACKRCRPDAAPGSPEWDSRADLVARAMRLIADGVVDRDGVGGLASRLCYSTRQIERLLMAEVGAGPLGLARAQRAQSARVLVETTTMPMAQVAFAAGFASIRQFNDTVQAVFAVSASELRRKALDRAVPHKGGPASARAASSPVAGAPVVAPAQTLALRLPFRSPLCPDNLFGHLAATAVPGVEEMRDGAYRRTLRLPHGVAIVTLRPAEDCIWALLSLGDLRDLTSAVARCRRLLDLDADPEATDQLLCEDPVLAPLVRSAPGRRVPRTVDEQEMAVRAVLGQQVSTAAARTHAGRLAATYGEPVDDPAGGLSRTFPSAMALAEALSAPAQPGLGPLLAGPRARQATFAGLVAALADGKIDLGPGCEWDEARAQLGQLAGVGPWTTEIIAMRALGDPDAFPLTDLGMQRAALAAGFPKAPSHLAKRAERWRPWRAYATQYLWATLDHPINNLPSGMGAPKTPSTNSGTPSTKRSLA
jgi:AraC family transcriptional regulator of adaptative response / DNA-3-methyladenine glycosylase II